MDDWRKIERVRKDPGRAAIMCRSLLKLGSPILSDWEIDFLESVERQCSYLPELYPRQAEKLVQIEGDVKRAWTVHKFSVRSLITQCYEARADLNEEDEEWIIETYTDSYESIRWKHIGRLLRLARQLGIIDKFH